MNPTILSNESWYMLRLCVVEGAKALPWVVSADAPEKYSDLLESYQECGFIKISPFGCDTSIYGSAQYNHCFRAWHDALHIKHKLSFTVADELEVARKHLVDAAWYMADQGVYLDVYKDVLNALWVDVAGQRLYYAYTGKFLDNQIAFFNYVFPLVRTWNKDELGANVKAYIEHENKQAAPKAISIASTI